jgi:hypothetical protein
LIAFQEAAPMTAVFGYLPILPRTASLPSSKTPIGSELALSVKRLVPASTILLLAA